MAWNSQRSTCLCLLPLRLKTCNTMSVFNVLMYYFQKNALILSRWLPLNGTNSSAGFIQLACFINGLKLALWLLISTEKAWQALEAVASGHRAKKIRRMLIAVQSGGVRACWVSTKLIKLCEQCDCCHGLRTPALIFLLYIQQGPKRRARASKLSRLSPLDFLTGDTA